MDTEESYIRVSPSKVYTQLHHSALVLYAWLPAGSHATGAFKRHKTCALGHAVLSSRDWVGVSGDLAVTSPTLTLPGGDVHLLPPCQIPSSPYSGQVILITVSVSRSQLSIWCLHWPSKLTVWV